MVILLLFLDFCKRFVIFLTQFVNFWYSVQNINETFKKADNYDKDIMPLFPF